MHAVTPPKDKKHTRITLPSLYPWRAKRGHAAHRGGAGTHGDRRTKRVRTRGDQKRLAMNDE